MIIKLVPKFVKTVATFSARDPWNGERETGFHLDAYVRVPETRPNMRVSATMKPVRYLLALAPASGGEPRLLPESLAELWRRKEVADQRLPAILHSIEPRLASSDFRIYLASGALQLFAAFAAVMLGAVGALAAALRAQEPMLEVPMYAAFVLAIVAPAIILAIVARRRGVRRRQIRELRSML